MLQLERIIGHRGACAYAPENTLTSFEKARALGCRMIEFDVMLSADGEAFVFHDETLNRTTNGRGQFGLAGAEYLQSLDAGSWFSENYRAEKIPTLCEALAWLVSNNMQANIEIKPYPGTTEQTTTAVLSHLNRYWPQETPLPLLSSFDLRVLTMCRSIAPEMPLGLLLHEWQENCLQTARDLSCFSVHLNRRILTRARVQAIKQHDYKVCAYTINRKRQANKLFGWGVDAIFSDYPDLLS